MESQPEVVSSKLICIVISNLKEAEQLSFHEKSSIFTTFHAYVDKWHVSFQDPHKFTV